MSFEISPDLFGEGALPVALSKKAKARRLAHTFNTADAFDIQKLLQKVAADLAENYRVAFNGNKTMNGKAAIKLEKLVFDLRTEEGIQSFFDKRKKLQKLQHPVFVILDKPEHVSRKDDHSEVRFGQAIVSDGNDYVSLGLKIDNAPLSDARQGLGPDYWGAMVYAIDNVDFGQPMAKDDPREPDRYQVSLSIGSQGASRVHQCLLYQAIDRPVPQTVPAQQAVFAL